jgi:hypothetical protein
MGSYLMAVVQTKTKHTNINVTQNNTTPANKSKTQSYAIKDKLHTMNTLHKIKEYSYP